MANSRRPHARQHKADVWSSAPDLGGRTSSCAADREDAIPPAGVLTQESSEASGLRNVKTGSLRLLPITQSVSTR